MIVDSSAIFAIVLREPDHLHLLDAMLDYGDCFACAPAKEIGEPLLFKGHDFDQTDIAAVLKP